MLRGADATTLTLVAEQTNAHGGWHVRSVGFSPDGTRIVSGSDDYSVKVWGGRRPLALLLSGARGVLWGRAEGCAAEGACVCG